MLIGNSFPQFKDADGSPLNSGSIYFGVVNLNPETNPITVYWDSALTQAAAQPIRTLNGFIVRDGAIANLYAGSDYSVTVKNNTGILLYSLANSLYFDINSSVAAQLTSLSGSGGSNLIGFLQAGAGAVARTAQSKMRDFISVLDFGAKGDGVTNDSPAIALAVTAALANKRSLYFPGGSYLLNGIAGSDTYANGVLIPFNSINTDPTAGLSIFGDAGETVLKANANNIVVLRISRNYSTVRDIVIDGNGKTGVIGVGIVPESITQTTTQVSQSFVMIDRCGIQNCTEGMLLQPGPQVGGADSGCFYHTVSNCYFNLNTRHLWAKKDATALGNRTTRSVFSSNKFLRGNTGIQIDGGTELDFVGNNFELIATGVTPSATPTAFNYNDTNPANIKIIGGYAEACSKNLVAVNTAAANQMQVVGFIHNGATDVSEANMQVISTSVFNVPAIAKTFKGSIGNVTIPTTGAGIGFSRVGTSAITAPVGGSIGFNADGYSWSDAAGSVDFMTLSSTEFIPRVDNAISFGVNGLRWKAIWAANGTIQTSDPRTKNHIIDSPLGLDFINALHPVAYKFKVGGNAVVKGKLKPEAGKRQHFGFLTTDVKEAARNVDFGGYVKTDINDPNSEEGLRYDEFIAPLVKAVQELSGQLEKMKLEITSLKNKA